MTVRSRFIKSVIATAKANQTEMPWARGKMRQQMIQRRDTPVSPAPRIRTA